MNGQTVRWKRIGASCGVFFLLGPPGVASARGWPTLRHGEWEITRTMENPGGGAPRVVTAKRCMTPAEDWDRQNAQLEKAGCAFSAVTRDASGYWFTATCKLMGTESTSKTTIVPEGDSAYTLTVTGTTGGRSTREVMKARRVGECAR